MLRFGLSRRLFEEAADGGGGTGAFDAAAFQTTLMAEVTKAIAASQTAAQKAWKTELAKFAPKPDAAAAAAADAAAAAAAAAADPAKPRDPLVAGLERQNKEMAERFRLLEEATKVSNAKTEERERVAEEKERHAAIRASLGDYAFSSDDAREDAFRGLRDEVKRGEDGEIYGGDFVPAKDFIKTYMSKKTYLLAPKDVSSAGARAAAGMHGGRQVQMEDIKPGMDPKAREAAWAAVRAQLPA